MLNKDSLFWESYEALFLGSDTHPLSVESLCYFSRDRRDFYSYSAIPIQVRLQAREQKGSLPG